MSYWRILDKRPSKSTEQNETAKEAELSAKKPCAAINQTENNDINKKATDVIKKSTASQQLCLIYIHYENNSVLYK